MIEMYHKSFSTTCFGLLVSMCSFAQVIFNPPPAGSPAAERHNVLSQNTQRMEITLAWNRIEYFPGEEATLSIHVRNPTNETLEIYDPLGESVTLTVYKKDSLGKWEIQSVGDELMMSNRSASVWLAPRQERSLDLRFPCCQNPPARAGRHEFGYAVKPPWHRYLNILLYIEGEYRIVQNLGRGSAAEFKIVYPTVISSRRVQLEGFVEMHFKDRDGVERDPPKSFDRSLEILTLRYGSTTVVTVQRGPQPIGATAFKTGEVLTPAGRRGRLTPFFRLEETDQQVTEVQAVADKDDILTIDIRHSTGEIKKIRLDASREVLPQSN